MMQIRAFQPDDQLAVIALWQRCDLLRPWNDPVKDMARKMADSPEWFLLGEVDGQVVGSRLLGQDYPGPGWFYPRPSASQYDAMASGAANLGPDNPDLVATIAARQLAVAAREGVSVEQVPADAVTTSASGLDPGISPAYAQLQVARVARETGLAPDRLRELIDAATMPPGFGALGERWVNVQELNLAVAQAQ